MDKLLINKAASSEEKLAVLEDLKDLRQAVMVSIKRPEALRAANTKEALDNAPSESDIEEAILPSEPGPEEGTTIKRKIRGTYFYGPNSREEIDDIESGNKYGTRFVQDNHDQQVGSKNFLIGLSNVIGLASAVAALPPGPMAMSVGSMAKEEAFSNYSSQASGTSASQGGSAVLLGLGGLSAHTSASSHQSSANGVSGYSRESTDERLATSIQELDFHMEQAEARPANKTQIKTQYREATYQDKEVSTFFGLSSKTVTEEVSSSGWILRRAQHHRV